jgi:hypothetical protein
MYFQLINVLVEAVELIMDEERSVICKLGSTRFSYFNSSLIPLNPYCLKETAFVVAYSKTALVPFSIRMSQDT